MKHYLKYLPVILLSLASCKKSNNEHQPVPVIVQQPGTPMVKPAGNTIGTASSQQIGAQGGTISSGDGIVSIEVPAGAVTSNTNFSIQRVESNMDTLRTAYRFLPENVAFAKPVKIIYHYGSADISGNDPNLFHLVYRDAQGHYFQPAGMTHDPNTKTYTIQTTHFSDWNITENYEISVDLLHARGTSQAPHLDAEQQVNLTVAPTYAMWDDTSQLFIPPLTASDAQKHADWKIVSGPGSLEIPGENNTTVTYHTPANLTAPATVQISCTMTGDFGKDNFGNPVKKMILLQTIYLDASTFSISLDGADPIQLSGIGVVDQGIAITVTGQDFAGETFVVTCYGNGEGSYAYNQPGNPGTALIEMTTLTDLSYHTYYPKDCNGNNDKLTFSSGSVTLKHVGTQKGDYVSGTIDGTTVYGTNWCSGPGTKKHLISGSFSIKKK